MSLFAAVPGKVKMVPQARPAELSLLPQLHPDQAAVRVVMHLCLQAHVLLHLPLLPAAQERIGSVLPAGVRACFQHGLDEAGQGAGRLLMDQPAPMTEAHPGRTVGPADGPEVLGPEESAWLLGFLQDKHDQ